MERSKQSAAEASNVGALPLVSIQVLYFVLHFSVFTQALLYETTCNHNRNKYFNSGYMSFMYCIVCLGYVPPPDQIETQAYDADLVVAQIQKQDSFASDATTLILGRSNTISESEDTQVYEACEAEHASPSKQPTCSPEVDSKTCSDASTAAEPGNGKASDVDAAGGMSLDQPSPAEPTTAVEQFSVLDFKARSLQNQERHVLI